MESNLGASGHPIFTGPPPFDNRTFDGSVVRLEGPLRAPNASGLRRRVIELLCMGERNIVLDLSNVPHIDAAGVGELVHAYRMTLAANGALHIVRPTEWVREILKRVGLLDLLSAEISGVLY
jgi:anti-anti-sigma factor